MRGDTCIERWIGDRKVLGLEVGKIENTTVR
jgi:hypothetical protein